MRLLSEGTDFHQSAGSGQERWAFFVEVLFSVDWPWQYFVRECPWSCLRTMWMKWGISSTAANTARSWVSDLSLFKMLASGDFVLRRSANDFARFGRDLVPDV